MSQPLLLQRAAVLGEQVADVLRRRIITQELPTGLSLVESKLAEQFQVSRGPIRDAIKMLSNEGLVETSGRSATVIGLAAQDIDELFGVRSALERLALQTAVPDRRGELGRLLDQALTRMRDAVEAADPAEFTLADMQFHSAFGAASRNRRLCDVWTSYQRTIENLLLVANLGHDDLAPSLASHVFLADLISSAQDAEALDELHAHLDNSRLRLRKEFHES